MGGSGSTRWGCHSKATTTEHCLCLDLFWMTRNGFIGNRARSGSLNWSRNGQVISTIGFYADCTGVFLSYTVARTGQAVEYRVPLAKTEPHLGGQRWWFVCPLAQCGRRVAKLYLPPGASHFGCRSCYRLTYASCGTAQWDRSLSWAQKVRERLGGSGSMLDPFPGKPKGMWWRTYRRLRTRVENAERSLLGSASGHFGVGPYLW